MEKFFSNYEKVICRELVAFFIFGESFGSSLHFTHQFDYTLVYTFFTYFLHLSVYFSLPP